MNDNSYPKLEKGKEESERYSSMRVLYATGAHLKYPPSSDGISFQKEDREQIDSYQHIFVYLYGMSLPSRY